MRRRGVGRVRRPCLLGTAAAQQGAIEAAVAEELAASAAAAANPPPAGNAGAPDELFEQLQKLAGLRDPGILTEEEFTAKEAQLLGL